MFTAKKARHDQIDASPPATSGPIALPTPPAAPQSPIANARRDQSNITSITASDVVKQHADATPCSARPASNTPNEPATAADGRRGREQHDAEQKEPPGADAVRDPADEDQRRGEPEGGDAHEAPSAPLATPRSAPIWGSSTATPLRSTDNATSGRLRAASASHALVDVGAIGPAYDPGRDGGSLLRRRRLRLAVRCLLNGVPYRMADPQETIATAAR